MDESGLKNQTTGKLILLKGSVKLWTFPMIYPIGGFFAILLPCLLFDLKGFGSSDENHVSPHSPNTSGIQDVIVQKITIESDPPSHPISLEVDDHKNIWVIDKLNQKNISGDSKGSSEPFESKTHFRIVTYKDTNGDGHYEDSSVFLKWSEEQWAISRPVLCVAEGKIHLGTGSQFCVIQDIDQDGEADLKRDLISAPGQDNPMANVLDIARSPDGWLFFSMNDPDLNRSHLAETKTSGPVSAIFKCRADGSDLQKFATGLNQPGDLVFDAFGNLFTSDRNPSLSHESRWIYVTEGADYGYRSANLQQTHQQVSITIPAPSFALPNIASIQGQFDQCVYTTHHDLSGKTMHQFYACDSSKILNGIYTFSQNDKDVSFRLTNFNQWDLNLSPNDVTLGPEGRLYLTHMAKKHTSNRSSGIYTILQKRKIHAPELKQTASILNDNLNTKTINRLLQLLQHKDQRVRIKAQSALVARGNLSVKALVNVSKDPQNLWARIHSIWAINQLVESDPKLADANYIQSWIVDLMRDPSPEIRVQAAIVAGRTGNSSIYPNVIDLLKDPSDRVRQMAAVAIGKLKVKNAWDSILEFVASPENQHPLLRHASVMAMTGACSEDALSTLVIHKNEHVRQSSTLALRQKGSVAIARFLKDSNHEIALEAARAIHDLPIRKALPKLAQFHLSNDELMAKFPKDEVTQKNDPLLEILYYIYHSNFLLGKSENLKNIVAAASTESLPDEIRNMCLNWVKNWMEPGRTQINIAASPLLQTHEINANKEILKQAAKSWLESSNANQQEIMLGFVESFNWIEFQDSIISIFRKFHAKPKIRAAALRLMFRWEPNQITPLLNEALVSNSALLRKEAVLIQSKLNPNDEVAHWTHQLEFGELKAQQGALTNISNLSDRRVDAVILHWLEQALNDNIPSGLKDHLQQAAAKRTPPAIKKALEKWQMDAQSSKNTK